MASQDKMSKVYPSHKKGQAFDGKDTKVKGVSHFSSAQRREEERKWMKDVADELGVIVPYIEL